MPIKWEDRYDHLNHLPESQLFDLARNESADVEFRQCAVEIMRKKGYTKSNHPEIAHLSDEPFVQLELPFDTIQDPMTCGVTTETMFGVQAEPVEVAPLVDEELFELMQKSHLEPDEPVQIPDAVIEPAYEAEVSETQPVTGEISNER